MLSQLVQDVEALVRRSYPTPAVNKIMLLARNAFTGALQDYQLQVYIKQAHPGNLEVVLVRAMEFEAFLKGACLSSPSPAMTSGVKR